MNRYDKYKIIVLAVLCAALLSYQLFIVPAWRHRVISHAMDSGVDLSEAEGGQAVRILGSAFPILIWIGLATYVLATKFSSIKFRISLLTAVLIGFTIGIILAWDSYTRFFD